MAVKTKSVLAGCCGWKFLLVLTGLCTLSYYLWHKIYYVLFHQKTDGWWYFELLWSKFTDKNIYTELTKVQFYKDLFHSINDDFITCVTLVVQLLLQTGSLIIGVLFSCGILSVITYIIYCVYSNKESQPGTEQQKKRRTNGTARNKSKTSSTSYESSKAISLSQSRKLYQRWAYGLLFFAFLVSIPWEFVRLYQSMVAEKVAQMKAGIPAECVPEEMTFFQRLQSVLRKQISWSDDPCLVYHKALLVDPMWQVNPLMVVMSAFSHCVVKPAEILFGGLGKSFRLFFTEIPAQWQPFMLIVIVIIFVLTLIMLCGYRVHFPFLLKLEPKSPRYVRARSENSSNKNRLNDCLMSSQETLDQSSLDTQASLETQQ